MAFGLAAMERALPPCTPDHALPFFTSEFTFQSRETWRTRPSLQVLMGCGGETSFISIFEYSNKLGIGDGGSVGLQKKQCSFRRPRNCTSAWNVSDATPSGIIYAWEPEWCYHWWRPTPPDSQGRNSKVVGARTTGFGPEWGLNEFNWTLKRLCSVFIHSFFMAINEVWHGKANYLIIIGRKSVEERCFAFQSEQQHNHEI